MVGYLLKALFALALLFSVAFSQEQERSEARDYQVAYGLFRDGQYQLALEEFRNFISSHPDSPRRPDAAYLSAECLMNDGKPREAARAFEAFIKSYPRSPLVPDAHFRLGEMSYSAMRYEEAIGRYRAVVEKYPETELAGEAAYWTGESHFKLKEYDQALSSYRLSAEKYPKNRVADYALYSVGWTLEQKREFGAARKVYADFAAAFPRSPLVPSAKVRIGAVLIAEEKYDAAISALRDARSKVATDDARGEAVYLIGEAEFKKGENGAALKQYQEVVSGFPGHRLERDARYGIGWVYLREKNFPEAVRAFSGVTAGTDELAEAAQYRKGQALKLNRQLQEARKEFEGLVARRPKGPFADNALLDLGMLDFERKEIPSALSRFEAIVKEFPSSDVLGEANRMIGECHLAAGEFERARGSFNAAAAVPSAPPDVKADALFQEGWSLYRLNRFADAAAKFGQLTRTYPEHSRADDALFWQGESEYKADRYREAFRTYDRLLTSFPSAPKTGEALYGKGWAASKLGDHASAAKIFAQAAQRFPSAAFAFDARVRSGDALFALKDFDGAAAAYRGAIRSARGSDGVDYPLFQLAQATIRSKGMEKGIQEFRTLIEKEPKSEYRDDAEYAIGRAYFQQKEYLKAAKEFRALVERAPKSPLAPRALLSIADGHYNEKAYPQALAAYREVLGKYPESKEVEDALSGIEYCYGATGNEAAAGSIVEEFVRANPSHPMADRFLYRRGELFFGKNDFGSALPAFRAVEERYPKSPLVPQAKYWAALSLESLGRGNEAIPLLREITAPSGPALKGPLGGKALIRLGVLTAAAGDRESALRLFDRAEKEFAGKEEAIRAGFEKGEMLRKSGDLDQALAQFSNVAAAHPGTPDGDRSRLAAARILLDRGESGKAKAAYEEVAAKHADEIGAEAQYMLGEIPFRAGEYKQAAAALIRIKYLYPTAGWWIARGALRMGESYEKLGELAKAREAYQSVVRLAADRNLTGEAERRLKEIQ